jgi:type I restriction enzyme M protein
MNKLRPETIKDKAALFNIFRRVENCFGETSIEPGRPRFFEFANLLFLKLMEEHQQDPLWASLKEEENKIQYLNGHLIPSLQTQYNAEDVFSKTEIPQESVIKKILAILDTYHLTSFDSDIMGDAYEYFLKKNLSSKQSLGQYFTPRHIVRIMVDLVSPTRNDTIYDPFCGAGGLLAGAAGYIKEFDCSKGNIFFGKDISVSARVAKMNAILHWRDHSGIEHVANTLSHPVYKRYSVGLTNVPFSRDYKNYQYDGLYENGLARKKTDVLSILHLFQSIQKGGRMAAIVPEGFLLGIERADARRFLTDNADLRLVVSLPDRTFLPYTRVRAALIYLENLHCPDQNQKKHFWYFDAQNDVFTFDKYGKKLNGPNSLDTLKGISFNKVPEEEMLSLGYTKVPFEKMGGHQESWVGKHYLGPSSVSSPYPLVPLGQLVNFISTGFSYNVSHLSDNDGIPLFTLKSIGKGFLSNYQTKFLKYETQTYEKNICLAGDVLMSIKDINRESAILGKTTVASKKGIFSHDLVKLEIVTKNLLSSEYLYYFFKNETYAQEIKKFSAGSIMKRISLADIASIKIPLPPLDVQKQVVKEFNHYEKLIASQNEIANFLQEKCQERLKSLWA